MALYRLEEAKAEMVSVIMLVTLFKGIIKLIQGTDGYNGIKYFTKNTRINFGLALCGFGFSTEYTYNLPW